jgi:hypothetical protein
MSLIRLLILVSLLSPPAWRATTDEGVGLDPFGRPIVTSATCDEGNGLDPHGGCRATNTLDSGPIMDPNG